MTVVVSAIASANGFKITSIGKSFSWEEALGPDCQQPLLDWGQGDTLLKPAPDLTASRPGKHCHPLRWNGTPGYFARAPCGTRIGEVQVTRELGRALGSPMVLCSNPLEHGADIDGRTLADVVEVAVDKIVGGLASNLEQMSQERPLSVELA